MGNNIAVDFLNIWKAKIQRVRRLLARLPLDVAREALAFTIENFNRQQTPDGKPWAARKDVKNNRALLVRTGRLRKSIRIQVANTNVIRLGTDLNYSKFIQQGTPKMVARPFLGNSKVLQRRILRLIDRKVSEALH